MSRASPRWPDAVNVPGPDSAAAPDMKRSQVRLAMAPPLNRTPMAPRPYSSTSLAGHLHRSLSQVLPAARHGAEPIIAGPLSPELQPWVQLPWEPPRTITLMVMAIPRHHAVFTHILLATDVRST